MNPPTLGLTQEALARFEEALSKEWLVTNGLGGYASSTALGLNTRKYHGLLVVAMHPPGDRTVCLAKLDEEVSVGGNDYRLGANEFKDAIYPQGHWFLKAFSVSPFPRYVYSTAGVEVEKNVFMPLEKNAAVAVYRVLNETTSQATIKVTPLTTCRHFHLVVDNAKNPISFTQQQNGDREMQLVFAKPSVVVTLRATDGEFHEKPNWINRLFYREEAARGESSLDDCYEPGHFEVAVPAKQKTEFAVVASASKSVQDNQGTLDEVGSTMQDVEVTLDAAVARRVKLLDDFHTLHSSQPMSDWLGWALQAADSFVVNNASQGRSVIAGYHWFEAWGRDTFISLPGLMLVTGRFQDARQVLAGFGAYCTHGLIPNYLNDSSGEPVCNTVDATLWHINAVLQYVKYTGDFDFVRTQLWETLKDAIASHVEGTLFDIRLDGDGLLSHGPRLTWMDAEVDGAPVTPRAGKAVEIQALWYNALRTAELLARRFGELNLAESCAEMAGKAGKSFLQKFWNRQRSCLFDVVGDSDADASLRPNQVIAASLDFTMLDDDRSRRVVDFVQREFLTPCGLRTLSRSDPRYKGTYVGDRQSRDRAYHNGTVWPWLLGSFATAFLKAKGATAGNRVYIQNLIQSLFAAQVAKAGLGSVSEVFDGDEPHVPRGCISQAWSVAEPLRAYVEDALWVRPKFEKALV